MNALVRAVPGWLRPLYHHSSPLGRLEDRYPMGALVAVPAVVAIGLVLDEHVALKTE
ncbi:hypothetical protein ACGFRG_23900 [Streptomyces sp. NPDC048696]|uniref:hypothetical protein n=1 Tax=Streptomyces sp. NPDC048696 TaxID=3365585 RepID=UPI00371AA513